MRRRKRGEKEEREGKRKEGMVRKGWEKKQRQLLSQTIFLFTPLFPMLSVIVAFRRVDERGATADERRECDESLLRLEKAPHHDAAGSCCMLAVHSHRIRHVFLLH